MSLLRIEGFNAIGSVGNLESKGYSVVGTGIEIINNNPTPRNGLGCLKIHGYASGVIIPFASTITPYVGFGIYRPPSTNSSYQYGSRFCPIVIGNGYNGTYGDHLSFVIDSAGYIHVYCGSILLGTSNDVIPENTWIYIEIYAKASHTVGEIKIRLNGSNEILNLTNKDTIYGSGNLSYDRLILSDTYSANGMYYDDLYIDNTQFHGDCKIQTIYPDAIGNYSQFTPSVGFNYACVDETIPNDADYVEATTVGLKDSYNFQALNKNYAIVAVQLNLRAEKTDAGDKQLRGFTRISNIDYNGNTQDLADNAYTYVEKIWELNPATNIAWTKAVIDAAEFGQEVIT